jgi:hypothetical protein
LVEKEKLMKRLGLSGVGAVLAMVCLLTAGCAQKEKQRIAELEAQYNSLSSQNSQLRGKLSQAKVREAELLSQVEGKDAEVSGKSEEVDRLKAQLAAKPTPPPGAEKSPGGWDVGKFARGKSALDEIAADLRSTYRGMPVRVFGFTDSDPIVRTKKLWKDNLDLSANRAMAVTRYLIGKGVKPDAIETVAMGATNFVTKNDTRSNKAQNRRVEIVVIKQ